MNLQLLDMFTPACLADAQCRSLEHGHGSAFSCAWKERHDSIANLLFGKEGKVLHNWACVLLSVSPERSDSDAD
ncbi:hypothetical protein HYQ46_004860 [Verticillium longisporum]|nr:hypothetical protein HYQ46_004860 [Verticillium longisporum]